MSTLTISPSPHVHSGDSVKKNMYGVIIALIPALLVSFYNFGMGAVVVTITSIVSCLFFEHLIQKFLLKQETTIWDGSAMITGLLLAFNIPSNLPVFMIVIGALVSIGIGKMAFGGLGNNPFNPALVGRVFLLISFPVQMTSWPMPERIPFTYTDVITGATPLSVMKEAVANGELPTNVLHEIPSYRDLFLGLQGGSAGEMAGIAILFGFGIMLWRRIITWHIPTAVISTVFIFTGILHWINPMMYAPPMFHILSGGLFLGAVFMATDYSSSPMSKKGAVIFGIGIGDNHGSH